MVWGSLNADTNFNDIFQEVTAYSRHEQADTNAKREVLTLRCRYASPYKKNPGMQPGVAENLSAPESFALAHRLR
ncbi:MAG: hypothetical protein FJZ79_02765 [Chlorobi bacterium]|nr:hypothetical protein [Chlorobiota bacterium]